MSFPAAMPAMTAAFVLAVLGTCHVSGAVGKQFIGVNYGGLALSSNPLPYKEALRKMEAAGVTAVKLFDTYPGFFDAAIGSHLEYLAGTTGASMVAFANDAVAAQTYVDTQLLPYVGRLSIIGVAIGNEVLTPGGGSNQFVVPAMRNVYSALKRRGLHTRIKVVTASSLGIINNFLYDPPSKAVFDLSLQSVLTSLLQFCAETGNPFMLNVYPFFSEYFATSPNHPFFSFDGYRGYYDGGLYYQNQHDSMIDSVISSMAKLGFHNIPIEVGESGWPTAGYAGASTASVGTAQEYNTRLVGKWLSNQGTPLRPGKPIRGYLFEFFDEDRKASAGSVENSWGVYTISGIPKYALSFIKGKKPGTSPPPRWCIVMQSASSVAIQHALDYACSQGHVDCSIVAKGRNCFLNGNTHEQATVIVNAYFQAQGQLPGLCVFGGIATISGKNPSIGACHLPGYPAAYKPGGRVPAPVPAPVPPSPGPVSKKWCVAKVKYAPSDAAVQAGLDYACGVGGVNCGNVQPGASCYGPGTLTYIASYVFNEYFQAQKQAGGSCHFGGAAVIVTSQPSLGGCSFPSPNGKWCVATLAVLQEGLDYACSRRNVDCGPIQSGGKCYYPKKLLAHASFAFNAYFQVHKQHASACKFRGGSHIITTAPARYSKCI